MTLRANSRIIVNAIGHAIKYAYPQREKNPSPHPVLTEVMTNVMIVVISKLIKIDCTSGAHFLLNIENPI